MMSCSSVRARGADGVPSVPSSAESPMSETLQITTFYLRLCLPSPATDAPRSLMFVYASLERSDPELSRHGAPTSVALHRVRNPGFVSPGEAVYASTGPLGAACCLRGDSAGFRFEAYAGEEKAAEGVVHRDWERRWRIECWLAPGVLEVRAVGEGVDLRRSARWSPRARQQRRRETRFVSTLQRIPEEEEAAEDEFRAATALGDGRGYGGGRAVANDGYGGGYRRVTTVHWDDDHDGRKTGSYPGDADEDGWKIGSYEELRWVVDMGVWAVCVGVGLLLSRTAASGLRKGFFLLE